MKKCKIFGLVVLAAMFSAAVLCGGVRQAAAATTTIPTWNVGSGQPQGNFLTNADPVFPGGSLELGMRAIYRQSALNVPVTGDTYTVFWGPQIAGQNGAPVTNLARNGWNFDYHIYYEGGVQNLDLLQMVITSPAGNVVSAASFDMKVANNDNVTGSQPFPLGDSQDPAFYIQDSQNPVFAPWFVPTFDMFVLGTYTFTLTAVEGASTQSLTMNIDVVPAPGAGALLGLGGLVAFRRRR